MKVEVVSPERVLFSGVATQLITRTESGGEIAFLPGHTSFLGVLTENHTRIFLEDGRVQSVAIHGGFVEASGGHVTLLSDNAELAEDIDVARARAAKQRAESAMQSEHEASVAADLRRADARISATGGPGNH
jgi:F-type H+-transporting ATPase subunit epsilon